MPGTLKRLATEDGTVSPPPTKKKVQGTTTNKAVANFFKPASQREPAKTTWRTIDDSLLVCTCVKSDPKVNERPRKVAAFDFDSTLISSASGNRFARDANDWKWWNSIVPGRLQELTAEGYLVVVLSNQAGISLKSASKTAKTDMKRLTDFKTKVNAVLTHLDLPISLYAATAHDKYRKPRTGMWDEFLKDQGLIHRDAVDLASSYFVGDAGGRTGSGAGGVAKDFSCSDRDLAANVGINFQTPEEFFLGEEARPFARAFDPTAYLRTVLPAKTETSPIVYTKKNPLDLVMFCGSPGAGKSTLYWKHLKPLGYERVNQDILKTRERCLKAATEFLSDNKSTVIAQPQMNPESRTMLPKVAFTGFASRYREPTLEEGFQDITKIDFQFEGTDEQRAIWKKFWV
ncbi:DNA kinase/phosphatase Pnk1 [Taxawa tesnikishii (nom. ined.)]|nr:DNA kinase/phosphatase Pnk1 [Dothideales sp. JES 119]